MSNYKIMFGLRLLKSIISAFLDSFLVLFLGLYGLSSIKLQKELKENGINMSQEIGEDNEDSRSNFKRVES